MYYYIDTYYTDKIVDIIDILCTDLLMDPDNWTAFLPFGTMQNIVFNVLLLAGCYSFNYTPEQALFYECTIAFSTNPEY